MNFFLLVLVFSRDFRRPKRAKFNIFLKSGVYVSCRVLLLWRCFIVPVGAGVQNLSRRKDLPEVGSGPLVSCSLLLSALLLCAWYVSPEYGSVSRFEGVFSGFCGADVYLYGLRSLRGLCGFCTRE